MLHSAITSHGSAAPALERLRADLLALQKKALPKSTAGQAASHTLSFWSKLTLFLKYLELELSNNLAENSMRPIAIGRKNWLHLGEQRGWPEDRRHLLGRRELPTARPAYPQVPG